MNNCYRASSLSALLILAFSFGCATIVRSQESSSDQITRLKSAVVIVTTYDDRGKPLLQGSGFFIESEEVVTNLHVINRASEIRVEAFDGSKSSVQAILATDEKSDLALMRVDGRSFKSETLRIDATVPVEGEPITLISNPQGSHWKVTRGCIGLLWEFQGLGERLQITASILPGSSGGPVLNARGEVIGVAVMYLNSDEDLNFAIPVKRLKALQAQARLTEPGTTLNPQQTR